MLHRIRRSEEETINGPEPDQYIQLLAEVTEDLILEAHIHTIEADLVGMDYEGNFITIRADGSVDQFPAP